MENSDLSFPTGPQPEVETLTPAGRAEAVAALRAFPAEFAAALSGLTDAQLGTPYRPGGWTLRQVAHHVPDSHMNAYIRTRLALTEDEPRILPYDQDAWARLPDVRGDIAPSLSLLAALHARWADTFSGLTPEQWAREYVHPGYGRRYSLDGVAAAYVWHGRHHLAQVRGLRERQGW